MYTVELWDTFHEDIKKAKSVDVKQYVEDDQLIIEQAEDILNFQGGQRNGKINYQRLRAIQYDVLRQAQVGTNVSVTDAIITEAAVFAIKKNLVEKIR